MIRHVFLWRVAPTADGAEIVRILNELPGRIKEIRTWSVGKHQGEPGNSGAPWEYALTCDFDSLAALDAYSNHPFHQEVVAKLMPMFSDRAVCDFEL